MREQMSRRSRLTVIQMSAAVAIGLIGLSPAAVHADRAMSI